jgi:hypothetical protein
MERQSLYVSPGAGQAAVPRRAQALEQVEGAVDTLWERRLEPVECPRIASLREDVEHGR